MLHTDRVIICACASRSFIDKEEVVRLAASLRTGGYAVSVEPDLCERVMDGGGDVGELAASVLIACHPRAIRSLLRPLGVEPALVLDIRGGNAGSVLERMGLTAADAATPVAGEDEYRRLVSSFTPKPGADAWYPVLDKERCVDCGKCYDFCLFGVYTIERGGVAVSQPRSCKNNCPACARMCPERAIVFPKYDKSPINGGLEEEEAALSIDPKAVYADALRTRLAYRRASVSLLKKDRP